MRRFRPRLRRRLDAPCRALLALAVLAGCTKEDDTVNKAAILPMLGAVMNSDAAAVRRLAERHEGLDERDPAEGATPMIEAAETDQWPVVEILLDHGADIWAHDRFGVTAAQKAVTSRILRGSAEDEARLRVMEKLRARGYPFPPPAPDAILALGKRGAWPPHGTGAAR